MNYTYEEIQILLDPSPQKEEYDTLDTNFSYEANQFGFQLFDQMKKDTNLFFSPINLCIILSLLSVGAGGKTLQELQTVLQFPSIQNRNNNIYRFLKQKNKSLIELDFANAVGFSYQQATSELKEHPFLHTLYSYYETKFYKIQKLQNRQLLLLNAIHFDGEWKSKFDKKETTKDPFYTKDKILQIWMMHQYDSFYRHVSLEHMTGIELCYADTSIVMDIFISDNEKDYPISEQFRQLKPLQKLKWFEKLDQATYKLYHRISIPKFYISDPPMELKEDLKSLGIQRCFSELHAEFPTLDVYVSSLLHQPKILVDERGTKADSISSIECHSLLGSCEDNFDVNQPFLFFIRDKETGIILFLGDIKEGSAFHKIPEHL